MSSDVNNDESQDFADLLEQSFEMDQVKRGDIREAEILEIRDNEIVVDLGVKRDGFVASQDIERLDPQFLKSLNVGDHIPVYILNPNDRDGNLLVSINLGLEGQDWLRAQQLLESGEVVEAEVIGYNRGGLLVRFGRLEGFVPSSHAVDLQQGLRGQERREAMDDLIGQNVGVKVVEVNQGRRRLILSQREAQREWRGKQKERLLTNLKVGDVVAGRVTGIRDFGVFVDIGGADGLIHVSEMAWHRVPHPRDVVKVGDQVKVYVLELDHDNQRIALSLRRAQPDPWDLVYETYELGQVVEGTVSNVVDFGAFVVLPDGIEGLLHITEMADGTLKEPHSYLKRGDKVTVKIVRIEPERRRIGFTQAGLNLTEPTQEPAGEVVNIRREDLTPPGELPSPTDILTSQEDVEIEDADEALDTAAEDLDVPPAMETDSEAMDAGAPADTAVDMETEVESDVMEASLPTGADQIDAVMETDSEAVDAGAPADTAVDTETEVESDVMEASLPAGTDQTDAVMETDSEAVDADMPGGTDQLDEEEDE